MNYTYLFLPAEDGTHLPIPEGWKAELTDCEQIPWSTLLTYHDPDLWPGTFVMYRLWRVKLCTKFERNRTISGWVSDLYIHNADAHLRFHDKKISIIARPLHQSMWAERERNGKRSGASQKSGSGEVSGRGRKRWTSGPEVLFQDLRRDEIRGWWWWWSRPKNLVFSDISFMAILADPPSRALRWGTPLSLAKIWPIISHNLETV